MVVKYNHSSSASALQPELLTSLRSTPHSLNFARYLLELHGTSLKCKFRLPCFGITCACAQATQNMRLLRLQVPRAGCISHSLHLVLCSQIKVGCNLTPIRTPHYYGSHAEQRTGCVIPLERLSFGQMLGHIFLGRGHMIIILVGVSMKTCLRMAEHVYRPFFLWPSCCTICALTDPRSIQHQPRCNIFS